MHTVFVYATILCIYTVQLYIIYSGVQTRTVGTFHESCMDSIVQFIMLLLFEYESSTYAYFLDGDPLYLWMVIPFIYIYLVHVQEFNHHIDNIGLENKYLLFEYLN